MQKIGSRMYQVRLDINETIVWHIDQLRDTLVPRSKVSFGSTQSFNVSRQVRMDLPDPQPIELPGEDHPNEPSLKNQSSYHGV